MCKVGDNTVLQSYDLISCLSGFGSSRVPRSMFQSCDCRFSETQTSFHERKRENTIFDGVRAGLIEGVAVGNHSLVLRLRRGPIVGVNSIIAVGRSRLIPTVASMKHRVMRHPLLAWHISTMIERRISTARIKILIFLPNGNIYGMFSKSIPLVSLLYIERTLCNRMQSRRSEHLWLCNTSGRAHTKHHIIVRPAYRALSKRD